MIVQSDNVVKQSMFSRMDINSDGTVSKEEAEKSEFSLFEIDNNLTKEEFHTKLFQEHYNRNPQKGLVFDVSLELTDIEKNEILSRIKDFENYKSSLSLDKSVELEKNKREALRFVIKDNQLDDTFSNYDDFLSKYNQVKSGDFSSLTNEDVMNIISYTDTTDLIQDGKIGSFNQGRTGDCWYLAMLQNYASTPEGAENIKNRIKEQDGNYYVTFQNPISPDKTEEYQITKNDLENYGISDNITSFSSGDLDVRIFEAATAKMLLKYSDTSFMDKVLSEFQKYSKELNDPMSISREKIEQIRQSNIMTSGESVKRALVHRAMGYNGNPVIFQKHEQIARLFLDNSPEYARMIMDTHDTILNEMRNSNVYQVELNLKFEDINGKPVAFIDGDLNNLSDTNECSLANIAKKFREAELVAGSGLFPYSENQQDNMYMINGHAYNIEKQNDDGITLNNPYNSGFSNTISEENFDNFFVGVTYFPLDLKS